MEGARAAARLPRGPAVRRAGHNYLKLQFS